MEVLKVAVCGARGKMGREAVKAIHQNPDIELVGAVDLEGEGEDAGTISTGYPIGIYISKQLEDVLYSTSPNVLVDFTSPASVMDNLYTCLKNRVSPVVGTTGFTDADFARIKDLIESYETGAIIVPNFALGAVLMMKFARMAARFFKDAEIIELHHDGKVDAPSGTALKTAQQIGEAWQQQQETNFAHNVEGNPVKNKEELEKLTGARGGAYQGVNIHSVRLPGLVAHQEVILGGTGQTLTIRHDSLDRSSFMPGLILAVKNAPRIKSLIYGLEHLMELE